MASPRDYISDLRRYYLPNARTRASNAWHQAVGRHVQGARGRFSNARNERARERGRRDLPARAGDQVRSRTPVVRDRVNRGTGRPHRDDRDMGRTQDQSLARTRQSRTAEVNRGHVRDTLAAREPRTAAAVERAVRDLSPRTSRRSR